MDISPYCGRVGYLSARTGEIGSIAQSHAAEHFLRGAQMSSLGWLVGSIRRHREDEKNCFIDAAPHQVGMQPVLTLILYVDTRAKKLR
ncbi:hypothetical protein [Tritonibacter mobilis]|uniref:hypothetical protein n=1 Tax=Tritonibacter mobilis TaxID=379347 RepID=UPI0022BDA23D|nr:hypothetical protein [Rhodobacteraceae bacterium G21628-S1]